MAKYLREIAKKSASISGPNSSTNSKVDIDNLNDAPGNREFAGKHSVQKWEDRDGNEEKVFKGSTKQTSMKNHGYKDPADDIAYKQANEETKKGMMCEACGTMYEGESCGCGKAMPEAKPGKKGMIVDKKKLSEMLKISEGAKVDRMVKHIKASEKAAGKSEEEAENIAWATANKRGMLNNKNKKKVQEQAAPADTPMKLTYPSDEVGQVGRV